jgi:peptidoglycan/LPS O-acetylase OafA/YrhL
LDGLRGLAALCVVLGHTIAVAFPILGWGPIPVGSLPGLQAAVWNSPLQIFCNGGPWVGVFFLLSGFVLSRAAEFSRADIVTLALRRYARLTVPSFFACLFALACLSLFPTSGAQIEHATGHTFLAVTNGALDTGALQFLRTTLVELYRGNVVRLDPPLWTMRIELFGSLGTYLLVRMLPRRAQVAAAVLWLLSCLNLGGPTIFYAMFPVGLMFERAWRAGHLRHRGWLWLAPLAVGFALGGHPWFVPMLKPFADRFGDVTVTNFIASLSATCLFLAVLIGAPVQRILTSAAAQFLGRNSFALYLLHFPLLAGPFAAAWAAEAAAGKIVAWSIAGAFFVTVFCCSVLFTRAIDAPLLAALHRVVLFRRRSILAPAAASSS